MVPLPLSSHPIEQAENPGIMLGKSPQRDREIDDICRMIGNSARAGIPALKYNMSVLGVVRSEPSSGRGGAGYSTFAYAKARQEPALTEAGLLPADHYWERITYFLDRVIPVAEEHKVRLACHPHDPGMPPGKGFRGVHTVLGSVGGLKRFLDIRDHPAQRIRDLSLDLVDRRLGRSPLGSQATYHPLGPGREGDLLAARIRARHGPHEAGTPHRGDLLARGRVGSLDRLGELRDRHRATSIQPEQLHHEAWLQPLDLRLGIEPGDLRIHGGLQQPQPAPPTLFGRVGLSRLGHG
jgi:hypothetical protein